MHAIYIKQQDFLFGDHNGHCNPVVVGYAYGLYAFVFSPEIMILKVGLKGIFFEIAKDARNLLF